MNHLRHIGYTFDRRQLLQRSANGFGAVALTALMTNDGLAAPDRAVDPLAPREPHFPATAKSVIFLYMDGGPSHVDTFDPKPQLDKDHGKPYAGKVQPTQFDNVGKLLKSPWTFNRYGESGLPVSDLFPGIAKHVDDIAFVRSMTSEFSEHTNGNYFLHTGHGLQGRPSMGSWVVYGLGCETRNLPGFVVLNGGLIPPGGLDCFHNGFLPASYQGSVFKQGNVPVADIRRTEPTAAAQGRKLDLVRRLDAAVLERTGKHDALTSAIQNQELAARMQTAVPELMDVAGESKATQDLYGINDEFGNTKVYGRNCLVARRLVERGVRFVQLTCPNPRADRWDQHGGLKEGHETNARAVDKPIDGLLTDLKSRGMLKDTLVVFAGEFGRTPMAQGSNGRDHNPFGFTIWMAGGGVKGGMSYGNTDEYGYYAVENKLQMHDFHATMLHLLGIDHERLTVLHSSREMRLTDVHGHVVKDIIA